MKPGKLYLKIFFSFIAILFVTEILIFILFLAIPGRYFRERIEQFTRSKAILVREVVIDKIRSHPGKSLAQNEQLRDFIYNFGKIMEAKVWLQHRDGTILLKSFSGEIPKIVEDLKKRKPREQGGFKIYNRRHFDFYAVIPISFPQGETGQLNILFKGYGPPRLEGYFALWLIFIGLIIALLIVPVSRLITKRVKQLRESALRIAEGDLSHRAGIKSRDEIGELASAFDLMTDKLERMIMSSKELNANVSHELRTPLARIRISEEMIREKLGKANFTTITRHMDNIREDIEELDSLIGKILELSKLDIHESPLKLEPLDPAELLRRVLDRFKPLLKNKGLKLETNLSFNKKMSGDRDALYTALKNIVDNAAKFTPRYGTIVIGMAEGNGCVKIQIQNSCEKLDEEDLTKIFDPFHRTDRTKKEGSGLGLTITKKIIERHGGKIGAFNSNIGLEIRIELPIDLSNNPG